MPVNFGFVATSGNATARGNGGKHQREVVEILGMARNLGRTDASKGKIARMADGGIDPIGATPQISDKSPLFVVNAYDTRKLPEAKNTKTKEGTVVEVLLDQIFYRVTCLLNNEPKINGSACDPRFPVKLIGAPKDLDRIILNSAPPQPITELADLDVPASGRLDSAFASTSGNGNYANNPDAAGDANNASANPYGTVIPCVPDPASDIAVAAPRGGDCAYGLPIDRPQIG